MIDVLEQFDDLLQEIFAAEDALATDPSASQSHFHLFGDSASSYAAANASLEVASIKSLIRLLTSISKRKATVRQTFATTYEPSQLGRLLKLLERSISKSVDAHPLFSPDKLKLAKHNNADETEEKNTTSKAKGAGSKGGKGKAKAAPKSAKKKTSKKAQASSDDEDDEEEYSAKSKTSASALNGVRRSSRSRSRSTESETEDVDELESTPSQKPRKTAKASVAVWTPDELVDLEAKCDLASAGILAATACLALLTAGKLPKQVCCGSKMERPTLIYPL